MSFGATVQPELDPQTLDFYRTVIDMLTEAQVPFLIGGTYALERYTGIPRHTKDLDVFLRRSDWDSALDLLSTAGYRTEPTFPHWLGKAYSGDDFVDLIFNSGNAFTPVDDEWFQFAVMDEVLGKRVRLCAPEEMIWTKAFVMERNRYDGADVAHLLLTQGWRVKWSRLLRRFGSHWEVLLSHLILFGFIYPAERSCVPERVVRELL
jgi:hypothetical protein